MNFDTKNLVRTCAALAVSLALALGLMACGSSDSGGSDEDQITDTITNAVEKSDETLCTEYFTQGFVEEITGEKGDEAISTCETQFSKEAPQKNSGVEVTDIKVDGDSATAKATFKSDDKKESASFTLKNEDDAWRIDGTGA